MRHISLLVLTHLHEDHVGGLAGVLHGRTVDAALVGGLQRPGGQHSRIQNRLETAGIAVHRAQAGQRWRAGTLRLHVVWPPKGPAGQSGHDDEDEEARENNRSVVLRAEWNGVTALLTGDIETDAQRVLAGTAPLQAAILKVPHHGSSDFDPAFLRAVGARLAITSVGDDNPYGHPSATTLSLLRGAGARSLRTDRDGAVAVVWGARGLATVVRGERD